MTVKKIEKGKETKRPITTFLFLMSVPSSTSPSSSNSETVTETKDLKTTPSRDLKIELGFFVSKGCLY